MSPREGTSKKARSVRIVLILVVLLLLLPPGLYFGINAALRGPAPAPAYTERDLPTLPPADENGWAVVAANGHRAFRGIDTPSEVLALCRHEDAHFDRIPPFAEVTASLARLRAFATKPAHDAALSEMHRALEKPAFADACPLVEGADCPLTELMRAHHLIEAEVLIALAEGRAAPALELATKLLRASVGYARAPRGVVSAMLGAAILRRDAELGARLVSGLEASATARSPEVEAALRTYLAVLGELDRPPLSMEHGIVGDYVSMRAMVLPILEGTGAAGTDLGLLGHVRAFTDPRDSMRRLDRYYVAIVAFAAAHGRGTPPQPDSGAHAQGWWLRNPGGKLLLDLGMSDMAPTIARYEAVLRQTRQRRDVVVAAARRWLDAPPPAAGGVEVAEGAAGGVGAGATP